MAKPVVIKSTIQENGDETIENAINIQELWYEGGYLNMLIGFAKKNDSDTVHLINLILDDSITEDGKYTFILRHNAFEEVPTEEDKNYSYELGYVSFPVADLIQGDNAEITMKWLSYKYNSFLSLETEERSITGTWKRIGYEHKHTNSLKMTSGYSIK